MNPKSIHQGEKYILASDRKSKPGCSKKYFELLKGQPVSVISKLNNFTNSNTVRVQGLLEIEGNHYMVSFWCSPYDLQEINHQN